MRRTLSPKTRASEPSLVPRLMTIGLRRVLREVEPQRLHALRGRPARARVERHLAVGDHLAEKRPHADGERVADDQHLGGIGVRDARPGRRRAREQAGRESHAQTGDRRADPAPRAHDTTLGVSRSRSSSRAGSTGAAARIRQSTHGARRARAVAAWTVAGRVCMLGAVRPTSLGTPHEPCQAVEAGG